MIFVYVDLEFAVDLTVEAELTGGVMLSEPSSGSGVAQITYNPIEKRLSWDISLAEPTASNLVQLHFHGPATRFVGGDLQVRTRSVVFDPCSSCPFNPRGEVTIALPGMFSCVEATHRLVLIDC